MTSNLYDPLSRKTDDITSKLNSTSFNSEIFTKGTQITPEIYYTRNDSNGGHLRLRGKSIMNNSEAFYKPWNDRMEEWVLKGEITKVSVDFDYFNLSGSDCIEDLLKIFDKVLVYHPKITPQPSIDWYYNMDDEEMIESGEYCRRKMHVKFNLIEKISDN